MTGTLAPLLASSLGSRITHGFFGRAGGVSTGLFKSLNCGHGSGDKTANVTENRARVAAALGLAPENLLTVYQTHSPDVLTVRQVHAHNAAPRADAMVTDRPGFGLGILTADCTPVLFAEQSAGVIGAAHAGWKGALGSGLGAGVLENTIAAMEALGAARANISAVIGPTIAQTNYEVGPEFKARFMADDQANERFNERFFAHAPRPDHSHFDLPAYCVHRLNAAGIGHAQDLGQCTYAQEPAYFSYRRSTHKNEPDYGRNISVIALKP